ncbi:MAG: CHAD domain-containing protein [bacterium]|nr:CHAD domain-containing protein [bacterium]
MKRVGRRERGVLLGNLVARILTTQWKRAEENRPGAAKCRNPERIHDMRVAIRRARTALKVFAPCVPDRAWQPVRKELAWLAGYLGAVRDYDVGLEVLAQLCAGDGLAEKEVAEVRAALLEEREKHVAALREVLSSERADKALGALGLAARQARRCLTPAARGSAREYLAAAILSALKDVQASGDEDVTQLFAEHLHQLRISFKRLRYLCEFARSVYQSALDEFIAGCVRIQDCLGRHQDLVAFAGHLEGLAKRLGKRRKKKAGRLLLTCGAVLERARARMAREREAFAELWREFPVLAEQLRARL